VKPVLSSIAPLRAVEGGRVVLNGSFPAPHALLDVTVGGVSVRVTTASATRLAVMIPSGLEGGALPVRVAGTAGDPAVLSVGRVWASGVHQVDSPVFDAAGSLYVTYSGSRGQESPVSIFRVTRQGTREPYATGIVNATSAAIGPDGALYMSSRFEGVVYRVADDGTHAAVASELGVACGLAFDTQGVLYVGDRSGTVFRVRDGHADAFASLPASVAAFHLAMSPSGDLYVTGPTLATRDPIYRITPEGEVSTLPCLFGRPQGLAFDEGGALHVVEALAGSSGVYRIADGVTPELVVSGPSLIGLAFGPRGQLVVTSNETAYRFD
jgi:sugar lactone lactonase YvrE